MAVHSQRSARPLAALVPVLGALAGAAGLGAQEAPAPVFGEDIEVRVVDVEVVVTDRSGRRVTGLTAEDFELLVDGAPVEIDYFSELAAAAAQQAQTAEPRAGVGSAPSGPSAAPAAPPAAVPTSLLVFVDDVFAVHARKRLVIENLIDQLDRLGPRDRVAVVSWTGRRLEVRAPWTSSLEDVERILQEAADHPSRGIYPRSSSLDDLEEALTAAASSLRLAGVPEGRKIMLLLAGKWPSSPFADDEVETAAEPLLPRREGSADFSDFERLWRSRFDSPFQPLVDTANSLGYTVYPVFTEGLPYSGPGVEDDRPGSGPDAASALSDSYESVAFLARQTGGRIMWAGNRFRALGRALADGRSYYLLGFTRHSGETERHRIGVRLKGDGLRARFRRSFVDFDSRMSAHSLAEAALLAGAAAAGSTEALEVRVIDLRTARSRSEVEFEVAAPLASLTFLPEADGVERARAELSFGVIDEEGTLSDIAVVPLAFDRPGAREPAVVTARQRITIRARPHDLTAVLRDLATGEVFLGGARLEPARDRRSPPKAARPQR